MNYVFISRHSERKNNPNSEIYSHQDRQNIIKNYEKSSRFKENPYDPNLTIFGIESAKQMGKNIIQTIQNNLDAPKKIKIFSSPFARCIETAGEIQNVLKHNGFGENPIHVEYGISESIRYPNLISWNQNKYTFEYKNFTSDEHLEEKGINNNINLDNQMQIQNLVQRFDKYSFETNYKPFTPFQNSFKQNYIDYANRISFTCQKILDENPNTFLIIILHGHGVLFTFDYFFKQTFGEKEYINLLSPSGYGSYFMFKKLQNQKPKLLEFYYGNTQYYKKFPKNNYICLSFQKMYFIIFLIFILFFYLFKNKKLLSKLLFKK